MNQKIFVFAVGAMLFALCSSAWAQQPKDVYRIGFLSSASRSSVSDRAEALRQGFRELGYVEGKNIIVEWRYAEGKLDRVSELAAELVRLKVDVIVSAGPEPTRSAKEATATIPIVMAFDNEPVASGFVASLSHPGGNITGLSTLHPEISTKRLELLKETIPRLSRVAVFGDSTFPGNAEALKETELAAAGFKVQLQYLDVRGYKNIEALFRAASKEHSDAVLVLAGPVLVINRKQSYTSR